MCILLTYVFQLAGKLWTASVVMHARHVRNYLGLSGCDWLWLHRNVMCKRGVVMCTCTSICTWGELNTMVAVEDISLHGHTYTQHDAWRCGEQCTVPIAMLKTRNGLHVYTAGRNKKPRRTGTNTFPNRKVRNRNESNRTGSFLTQCHSCRARARAPYSTNNKNNNSHNSNKSNNSFNVYIYIYMYIHISLYIYIYIYMYCDINCYIIVQ